MAWPRDWGVEGAGLTSGSRRRRQRGTDVGRGGTQEGSKVALAALTSGDLTSLNHIADFYISTVLGRF